ncbi:MAG: hypothetical protein WC576_01570 [Candidatus Omnitrophota bacterium]
MSIFLIVLFFICVRTVVMLSSERLIRQGEEPYVGTIALGLREGWAIPPWDFQVVSYNGGSVAAAALALPFFILFGPKIIALVLTSVFFHSLGLIFIFLLVEKYFNRRAAVLTSIFYILSPPLFMVRSLIIAGSHTEAATFSVILFLIFLNLIYCRPSTANYLLLGFLSGFSLWYSHLTLIAIITYSFIWLIRDKAFFLSKKYLLYLLSLALGFLPWYIYNARNSFKGAEIVSHGILYLQGLKFTDIFPDLLHFFQNGYKIFIFDDYASCFGPLFNLIYYALFTVSLLYLFFFILRKFIYNYSLPQKDNTGELSGAGYLQYALIVSFPCFYLLVYILSFFRYGDSGRGISDYRYAVILFPCIFISIALGIDKLLAMKNALAKGIGVIVFIAMIILGLVGNGRLVYSLDFRNNYLNSPAVYYDLVGRVAMDRHGLNMPRVSSLISKIKVGYGIRNAYAGYGFNLSQRFFSGGSLKQYIALTGISDMPPDVCKGFYRGVGRGMADSFYQARLKNIPGSFYNIEQFFKECAKVEAPGSYRDFFYLGVVEGLLTERWEGEFSSLNLEIDALADSLPAGDRYLAYLFYGAAEGNEIPRKVYLNNFPELTYRFNPDYLRYYYIGVGASVANFFSGDARKSVKLFNNYSSPIREYLLTGMGLYFCLLNEFSEDYTGKNYADSLPEEYRVYYHKARDLFKDTPLNGLNFLIGK